MRETICETVGAAFQPAVVQPWVWGVAVSYTHLTLPTILLV